MEVLVNGEIKEIGCQSLEFDWIEWFMDEYNVAGEDMNMSWTEIEIDDCVKGIWECSEKTYQYWQAETEKAAIVYKAEHSKAFSMLNEEDGDEYWEIYNDDDFVEFPNDKLLCWLKEKGIIKE